MIGRRAKDGESHSRPEGSDLPAPGESSPAEPTSLSVPRVLQVFASLDRGGAETATLNYYRTIDRSLLQYDFATHSDRPGEYEAEIRSLGGTIHRVPRLTSRNLRQYVMAWWHLLASHPEYVAIHGHYYTLSALYLAVAKTRGFRVIAHAHSSVPGWRGLLIKAFNLPLRYFANETLACSSSAGDFLFGRYAGRKRRTVILRNAIDAAKYEYNPTMRHKMRESLGVADKFVVAHVGRFDPVKNHAFLLDVFLEVKRINSQAVLLLVGKGNLKSELQEAAAHLGIGDDVKFLGSRPDVHEMLQAADVFCFPSLYEGLGIAAIEAQASGLPTIISDRLPKELRITDLVQAVSLDSPPAHWAKIVTEAPRGTFQRRSTLKDVQGAGYDIAQNVDELLRIYLERNT